MAVAASFASPAALCFSEAEEARPHDVGEGAIVFPPT